MEEASENPRSARVMQLPQRLGLDLADALARDRKLLTDLFQRVVRIHADAEAHADYTLLARCEQGERARRGLAQVRLDDGVDRQDRVLVLDEIAEVGILLVADRGFQRQRLFHYLEHLANLLERHAELLGKLLGRGLASDLVEQLARRAHDLRDCVHHVHGDTDGARLVSNRARDRLPDPPRGGRYCLPGSGRGTAGRGWCISWRWRNDNAASGGFSRGPKSSEMFAANGAKEAADDHDV